MENQNSWILSKRVLQFGCALVFGIILVAGLWPFHAPANQVRWIENENGLEFGRHGSIASRNAFAPQSSDDSGSLELWLKPAHARGTRTILAFEGVGTAASPFSLQQNGGILRVRRHNVDGLGTDRTAVFDVARAFQPGKPVFVTIVLKPHSTMVYLDGALARMEPIPGTSTGNFAGRLVLANSPYSSNSWPGEILGLASYQSDLTVGQVGQHDRSWAQGQTPATGDGSSPVALYLFNERAGATVHNQLDEATDLAIPGRYFVLHPPFMTPPWREYHPTWEYWKDFGVNVAGFIPLGFSFLAWFSWNRVGKWPVASVIALGFVTSLTIEILQAALPTRSSGMTDLFTNTSGTALGVLLYRSRFGQSLLARVTPAPGSTTLPIENYAGLVGISSNSGSSARPEVLR